MESVESVRDILEVFGAIDDAVYETRDPEVSAVADALLPGSAANAGWYRELESRFFGSEARRPNLAEALERIVNADGKNKRLTRAQKARLLYGISASARLRHVVPKCRLPGFDDADALFGGTLAAIAPTGTALKKRRDAGAAEKDAFLNLVSTDFTKPRDFDDNVRTAVVQSLRDGTELLAPLCQTAVTTIEGFPSVIVDTKFGSKDVSLDDLKAIVNPFNWDEDYANLFVDMAHQDVDLMPDGWRRVLETVRLLGTENVTTPLKFFPSQERLAAQVDYDLDKTRFDTGDKQVRVDRGFINMKSTSGDPTKPGVRVATRKVVHIEGISAFAQARLVCIGGYGTASADFLLGAATKPPKKPVAFDYPSREDQPDTSEETPVAAAASATTHFVPAAVGAWTESVQDLTNGYFDVAQKWLSGSLTMNDVADYSTRVSGSLMSAPWKYLQAMTTPRPPGQPGGGK
ncbi:hypothetical protein MycrhDRAFT_0762 [Mycolicibacterium rhodesiae JS60]|nr:hypothetical protein MycrhDRAFT_0762 [Mycolicibacterium rhodesiae JS60]